MDVVVGADGGNTKTELAVATLDGELVAHVRGPGSNSHALGADGTCDVLAALVDEASPKLPAAAGVFFLCGADVPRDVAELTAAIRARAWARDVLVDNDTWALLHAAGTGRDAVAVVCGAGINCVGRSSTGREARHPSLGWETGDWGGGEMLGREALFLAARAEDGRGEPTALVDLFRSHFGVSTVEEVGKAVHYRTIPDFRLGELAQAIVATAGAGDAVARSLVDRLAGEIGLIVERAFRDLALTRADVVLGGGMLRAGRGALHEAVIARLPDGARPVVLDEPPVLGAALAALERAGASSVARDRLRDDLRKGLASAAG